MKKAGCYLQGLMILVAVELFVGAALARDVQEYRKELLVKFKAPVVVLPDSIDSGGKDLINLADHPLGVILQNSNLTYISRAFPDEPDKDSIVYNQFGIPVKRPNFSGIFRIAFPDTLSRNYYCQLMKSHPDIWFVAPNEPLEQEQVYPNDPYFYMQWGLHNDGSLVGTEDADIDAPEAWEIETGNSATIIGIVDGGVMADHEDLAPKVYGDAGHDDHGTHVAGIAAANANNDTGIAGVDWHAQILSKRTNFEPEDIAVKEREAVDEGADVINNSYGTDQDYIPIEAAAAYAYKMNRVFVASKGNKQSSQLHFPSDYVYAFGVSASDADDHFCTWLSNYGNGVDVCAPGNYIYSTIDYGSPPYQVKNGTSMSAACVSGVASLLHSHKNYLCNDDIMNIIRYSADDVDYPPADAGYDDYTGWGRVNAAQALEMLQEPNFLFQFTSSGGSVHSVSDIETRYFVDIPGLADGGYYVKTYDVRKNVTILPGFIDTVLAWGRGAATVGYAPYYYNYGTGYTEVIDGTVTPSGCEVRTFVYEVWTLAQGDYVGWFPCQPSQVKFAYTAWGEWELLAPSNIYANNCAGGLPDRINISWDGSIFADYHDIYQIDTYGWDTTFLGTAPGYQHSWTAYDLSPYKLYCFAIRTRWGDLVSELGSSNPCRASGFPPAPASNLTAERDTGSCWWTISWDDNSTNEDGFWVRMMCQGIQDHFWTAPNVTSVSYYNDTWDENILIYVSAFDSNYCGVCDFQDPHGCIFFGDPPVSTVVFNDGICQAFTCPFLHVWDGERYRPENNLLAKSMSSTSPDRDYVEHHYLTVAPVESNGTYDFKIIEANNDSTCLNHVALYIFDHDPSHQVTIDNDGNVYIERGRITPVRVVDHLGHDVTHLVVQEDGTSYVSGGSGHLIVDFEDLPTVAGQAVGDPILGAPWDGSGGGRHLVPPKHETPIFAKVGVGGVGGNGGRIANHLDIFVLDDNSYWQFVESVYGATNPAHSYVPLEQFIKKDGSLTLKYQWNLAYRADEIAFSTTDALTEPLHLLHLLEANHSVSGDIRSLTDSSDDAHTVLKQGDTISLTFNAPKLIPGKERQFVMKVEGRYSSYDFQQADTVAVADTRLPQTIALHQNYPNPFNPSTSFEFSLAHSGQVTAEIYNSLGQRIKTVHNGFLESGKHVFYWDGRDYGGSFVASGVYFFRIESENYSASRKMVLIK